MPHFGSSDFNRVLNFDISTQNLEKYTFCCTKMKQSLTYICDQNHDKWECGDSLLHYNDVFDEYGLIIHDGGASYITIEHCPWCGTKLPHSKRDAWFNELEKLGFNDPLEEDIPREYKSNKWYL